MLACPRHSDSGEDAKEKGTRKVGVALSQFSGNDYLRAWNRLVLYRLLSIDLKIHPI